MKKYHIRICDIIISLLGLTVFFPLMIIISAAIKLNSKGPVFFSHYRLGTEKVPFKIYKFRSMVEDAEKNGEKWAVKNDTRITKVGIFLRKYRLDELPQLFNILRGDMSFVGPRPIREKFAIILEAEEPKYGNRFKVKPGLTGWAQLYAPYGSTIEEQLEKLPYDLKYLKGLSFWEYIRIIFLTGAKLSKSSGV